MDILLILGLPATLALASVFFNRSRTFALVNSFGHFLILCRAVLLVTGIVNGARSISYFNFLYVDALSALFILTISFVTFAASVYSVSYIDKEVQDGVISERKALGYYGLFNLFTLSMYFSTALNNLGFVWVAIEMTTLISAFLVGFYNNKRSVEAAWKYIVICSVGIGLALLGTMLFYYAVSQRGNISSLNWTDMIKVAKALDPNLLKIAFLFIIVGYGTKAGLVPMHTWLPDAHSQALAPISALLSGVLLETAIYAILRFTIIINKCAGSQYSSNILMLFGLASLGVSAAFILVQKDIKRLLAYSSVEHIGIICLGIGFGGALGLYGALFHIFNHAGTKSLMFFCAGSVTKRYKTNDMHVIKGISGAMPFVGPVFILGAFALAGSPPFSIFFSELLILISGFNAGAYIQSGLFILFAAIVFGGMIHHISGIVFGKKPEGIDTANEPLSTKLSLAFLFILILAIGFAMPVSFNKLLISAADIIRGIL
ncbi:MAG: hydrogenase 4 subunit F [Candidatus Omnitrophota bacterium]|nr:hydrogenase 4 subunit F [Candidatus Omnitrophota bacterium]